jgi:hypothetical protein
MSPIRYAKTTGAHFIAAWLAATVVACDSPPVVDDCSDPECHRDAATDGARRDTLLPPDALLPDSGMSRSPLCGTTGCFPGNWNACGPAPFAAPTLLPALMADDASDSNDDATDATGDAGADGGDAPGSADAASDACLDRSHDGSSGDVSVDSGPPDATEDAVGEPQPDATEDAGNPTDGGSPPTPDASGTDSGGRRDATGDIGSSDEPPISQSCYVKPGATGVITECAPIGPGLAGDPCNDSHECGPLLACIEVDQRAVCRPVYCALPPTCMKRTYYQEAPLRVNGITRRELNVPVCLPVDDCTLLATPNPCANGKICAVVGSEGETTCIEPGPAKVGDKCDESKRCGEGLFCSKFANECVKICHVGQVDSLDCNTGTCQGGNRSLPDGLGICVGQTDGG